MPQFSRGDMLTRSPDARSSTTLEKAAGDVGVISDRQFTGGKGGGRFDGLSVGTCSTASPSVRLNFGETVCRLPTRLSSELPRPRSLSVGAVGTRGPLGYWKLFNALEGRGSGPLAERKAVAAIVVSNDLLRSLSADAQALLRRELQTAVSLTTDTEALSALTSGIAPINSLGADAARDDISTMLQALSLGAGSKVFLLARSTIIKHLALSMDVSGRPAFPGMKINGGDIAGIEVLASDAVGEGEMVMVDASQVAAAGGFVALGTAQSATLRVSSTPDGDTTLTDLFGKNLVAIRAERTFALQRLRDTAVSVVTGAAYEPETV